MTIDFSIILVSSIVGISLNRSFVRGPQEETYEYSRSNGTVRKIPNSQVKRYPAFEPIEIGDVRKAAGTKGTVLLDGRTRQDYENGHLPGAYHLAVSDFEKAFARFSQRFPIDSHIIIYCRGGDCSLSRRLAELFYEKGYSQLRVYSAGYNEWFASGNPVEKGKGEDFLTGD